MLLYDFYMHAFYYLQFTRKCSLIPFIFCHIVLNYKQKSTVWLVQLVIFFLSSSENVIA